MELLIMLNGVDTVISKESAYTFTCTPFVSSGNPPHHILSKDLEQKAA